MPSIESDKVFRKPVVTVADFATSCGVSTSAIYQAINKNTIDYCIVGDKTLIVLTNLTKAYKPNESPSRENAVIKSKKTKK